MNKKLRPYQEEDMVFLSQVNTAGVLNEQRTGKTPTILKTLEKKNIKKVIIVCTATTLYQWAQEFEDWLGRSCVVVAGTPKQRQTALDNWTDGAVISYDLLKTTKNKQGYVTEILKRNPEAVIIDEAHRIKNHKSATAEAIFRLIQIPVRYALTGTLAHGKQHEIYSILHFLFPSRFTSYWNFIGEFFKKDRKTVWSTGRSYIEIGGFITRAKELQLQMFLQKHCTQRKRKDIMPWLPDKEYKQVLLPPTKEQKKYLKELKDYFETGDVVTQGVLDRLIRYRQICLDPTLIGLKGKSPKLEWLKQYIKDYPGEPTIVFSKFTSFIHKIEEELKGYNFKTIVGATPAKERYEIVQDFQNGKIDMLLINIDAGKEGLTLDRATTIIFTDKYPPAGDIQQAEDRFVATTKDKADKTHTIIELIMKGTYDEKLYKLVKQRAEETDVLNDYKKYLSLLDK